MEASSRQKPTLILIRGLIRSRYHWGAFPDRFSDNYRIITPEIPGNGELHQDKTPPSIPLMMQAVRDQVGQQHRGEISIIAISMGAMIAIEWARQYPEEIKEIHLINTSLANLSLPWQRMGALSFFKLLSCLGNRDKLERTIYQLTINTDYSKSENEWREFAKKHPLKWTNIFRQLIAASNYKGPLESPVEHAYFYNSLGDRLVKPVCTERIAQKWRKPLISHPDAGHDLSYDAPGWLKKNISQICDRRANQSTTNIN